MEYKELKTILLKFYGLDYVKHLLAKKSKYRPSYKMAEIFENKHGIPVEAWKNIRLWLETQKTRPQNKRKLKG